MDKRYILILLLWVPVCVQGQNSVRGRIWHDIHLDVGIDQVRERNLHPKIHRGPLIGINYSYGSMSRYIYSVEAGLSGSLLKTKYENSLKSSHIRLYANYYHLFSVAGNRTVSWFFGPEARLNYSVGFYPEWDESHMYWANYMATGFRNKFVAAIFPYQQLMLDISLPLIFIASRPASDRPYKMDDFSFTGILKNLHNHAEVSSWKKSFVLDIFLEHQMQTRRIRMPAFYYSLYYCKLRSIDSRTFNNVVHRVGVKFYL